MEAGAPEFTKLPPCKQEKATVCPVSTSSSFSAYPAHCLPAPTDVSKEWLPSFVWECSLVQTRAAGWVKRCSAFLAQAHTALHFPRSQEAHQHHCFRSSDFSAVSNDPQTLVSTGITRGDYQRCRCLGLEPGWDFEAGGLWMVLEAALLPHLALSFQGS